jgi:hypothetical protein
MNTTITVNFPKPIYQRLQRQAKVFKKPIDDVVVHTVERGLPYWLDMIPPDFEMELTKLEKLSISHLHKIAKSKLPAIKQRKLDRLLEKNSEGTITLNEIAELDDVQLEANLMMLKKAKALALLRSRGYPLPLSTTRR